MLFSRSQHDVETILLAPTVAQRSEKAAMLTCAAYSDDGAHDTDGVCAAGYGRSVILLPHEQDSSARRGYGLALCAGMTSRLTSLLWMSEERLLGTSLDGRVVAWRVATSTLRQAAADRPQDAAVRVPLVVSPLVQYYPRGMHVVSVWASALVSADSGASVALLLDDGLQILDVTTAKGIAEWHASDRCREAGAGMAALCCDSRGKTVCISDCNGQCALFDLRARTCVKSFLGSLDGSMASLVAIPASDSSSPCIVSFSGTRLFLTDLRTFQPRAMCSIVAAEHSLRRAPMCTAPGSLSECYALVATPRSLTTASPRSAMVLLDSEKEEDAFPMSVTHLTHGTASPCHVSFSERRGKVIVIGCAPRS